VREVGAEHRPQPKPILGGATGGHGSGITLSTIWLHVRRCPTCLTLLTYLGRVQNRSG
jgi:hypothetical protein